MSFNAKKLISVLLILTMIFSVALPAFATDGEQNLGTELNPYIITDEETFRKYFGSDDSIFLAANFVLANDITLTGEWIPVTDFRGKFNGGGHTISGINIPYEEYDNTGLFGRNSGTIENLKVAGEVHGLDYTGLLVGYNQGVVSNCYSSGNVYSESGDYSGGLIGGNSGILENSGSAATVSGYLRVGGLLGYNGAIVKTSYATGKVSGKQYVGGLIGMHQGYSASLTNSFAQGNVTADSYGGGLIGANAKWGWGSPYVRNCYAAGKVNDGAGNGLFGSVSGRRIFNCYYRTINIGDNTGNGVSTSDLKKQETFYMWDFDNIWAIDGGYPYLNVRGEERTVTFEGEGTVRNPYQITNEEQLHFMGTERASLEKGVYYRLMNDIELTARFWCPIAGWDNSEANNQTFWGVFDGNGHTISNLRSEGTNIYNLGLFGVNDGTIKNLTVQGVLNSDGSSEVGMIAALNSGNGVIDNCFAEGSITLDTGGTTGGMVGKNYGATVKNSGADVDISASGSGGRYGGIVGENEAGLVEGSYALGNISAYGIVGGLVGTNYGEINTSYATGEVLSTNSRAGGLVGYHNRGNWINNSYATGNVTSQSGNSNAGGLVGYNGSGATSDSYIRNCYATGLVNEGQGGGLAGSGNIFTFNSYYNNANVGNNEGFGVSLEEMKDATTFYMWDFDNIWEMDGEKAVLNIRGEEAVLELEGDGVEDEPFLISTEKDLYALAKGDIAVSDKTYLRVENDITLTAKCWTPIGQMDGSFQGIFDGNGHTISGLSNKGTNNEQIGLFANNSGNIKNLTVVGDVESPRNAGVLIGYNQGDIENCFVKGSVKTHSDAGAGGMIGQNSGGIVSNCGAEVEVVGKGNSVIGGLIGKNEGAVSYSFAKGNVTGEDYSYDAGGLIGSNYSNSPIDHCYATGDVTGDNYAGGLIGNNSSNSPIDYCYAIGDVSGYSGVGGLVGGSWSAISNSYAMGDASGYSAISGLSGSSAGLTNCYSTGTINATGSGYGLTAYNNGNTVSSYYNTEFSGMTDTDSGTPLTCAQMKDTASYVDWDFENVWAMSEEQNGGYPYLKSLGTPEVKTETKISRFNLTSVDKETSNIDILVRNVPSGAVVFMSAYQDGRFSNTKQITLDENGIAKTDFALNGEDEFKLFVFNGFLNLSPLCGAAQSSL